MHDPIHAAAIPPGAQAACRCLDAGPGDPRPGPAGRRPQARPAAHDQEPGDVRGRGRRGADHRPASCATSSPAPAALGFSFQIVALALVHACCSPTSPRPWPRAAARRRRPPCGARAPRPRPSCCASADGPQLARGVGADPQAGRPRAGRGRRPDPVATARSIEGVASVDEVGDHRRIGAGHPRERRRPLGGHRRHAVLSDQIMVRITAQPGLDLPRPHDRPGRGRGAAEDARTRSRSTSCWPA